MKSISMKDYFEFKEPTYQYLKLVPSTSVRNQKTYKIVSIVQSMYMDIRKRIHTINNKLFFECSAKASYYIYAEKGKVEFYFIVPQKHYNLFRDKIIDAWNNKITIEEVAEIPTFRENCTKYFVTYKKEDSMSVATDNRSNSLLNSIFTTLHIMEDGDKVGIFYNFMPCEQKSWRSTYDRTIEKLKEDRPIYKRRLDATYCAITVCTFLCNILDVLLFFIPAKDKKRLKDIVLANETKSKRDATVINTQIICLSDSENAFREHDNAISICQAFECLDSSDNSLIYKKFNGEFNPTKTKLRKADTLKISANEGQNFLALPGQTLLEEYKFINHTAVLEMEVPKSLRDGAISIGENIYKGNTTKVYLPSGKNDRNLSLVVIGPTRAGKTTLFSNIANDANKAGECNVFFDFCGNCELTDTICKEVKNTLVIDCSDHNKLQGIGYNEIKSTKMDAFTQYANAKFKTAQLTALVNSVNDGDRELKAKMNKLLSAAANVVFISNGSVKDVFDVLEDYEVRERYVNMVPFNQTQNLANHIKFLDEINETNKQGKVVGTKYHLISGIMDRLTALSQNVYMEMMLNKSCDRNFNLIEELQKNQTICFKMPDIMFGTQVEKDAYVTYWMTKLWISLKYRMAYIPADKLVKVNIFIDELYQVNSAEGYLRGILSQMAKYQAKPIISCHYLNQIGIIREELKSANCSYMLIAGCNKSNYEELKEELQPYSVEDLLQLKKYHSLNLIKSEDGYEKFVTKLPKPL